MSTQPANREDVRTVVINCAAEQPSLGNARDSTIEIPSIRALTAGLDQLPVSGRAFISMLLRTDLVDVKLAVDFFKAKLDRLAGLETAEKVGRALVQENLLTEYQLERIMAGTTHGLVLDKYRVLSRIGAGGMGVVFRAEHILMGRKVAIKVVPVEDDCPPAVIQRFHTEMRVLAKLQHPNIVTAFDCGKVDPQPGFPRLLYLVMELVDGCDLEAYILRHGPVAIDKACNWIRQAARGLQEAHDSDLVHRDIKPSNVLLTKDEKVKLVDFGLVREFGSSVTDPRSTLGTLDYMPPEQSIDPTSVGTHADIYSLGATLFWLLTANPPYPPTRSLMCAIKQLQQGSPRHLCELRPDAPPALDTLLDRLVNRDPMRRPPTALSVAKYLEPFALP